MMMYISHEYRNAYTIRLYSLGVSIFAFPYILPAFWYRKLFSHYTYRALIHCTRYFTFVFRTLFKNIVLYVIIILYRQMLCSLYFNNMKYLVAVGFVYALGKRVSQKLYETCTATHFFRPGQLETYSVEIRLPFLYLNVHEPTLARNEILTILSMSSMSIMRLVISEYIY